MFRENGARYLALGLLVAIGLYFGLYTGGGVTRYESQCPSTKTHRPAAFESHKHVLDRILHDPDFRNESVTKLQKAIQIRTEVHDDDTELVEDDFEYWSKFDKFEEYLNSTFPLFYSHVTLHKVNYHGLVYIWQGSNQNLKPLLLMAHQDTVPVSEDSLSQWEHDPFAGYYDGTNLHGRGIADCKDQLVGLFESAEELIKTGFAPKRTIIYSFGFDEEVMGNRNKNAKWIEQQYGADSIYAVVDEGGVNLDTIEGVKMSVPGTAEKGYVDLKVIIETPGGHSSIPPPHTSIGMMGEMIVAIENLDIPTYFTPANPAYWEYVCVAEHSPQITPKAKKSILNSRFDKASNKDARKYIDIDLHKGFVVKSTQALDIVFGGVKANALPEYVELTINVRIAMEETVEIVSRRILGAVEPVAEKYGLGLTFRLNGDEKILDPKSQGHCLVNVVSLLEPAPVTPINDEEWDIFAGTIKHVYEDLVAPNQTLVVAPGIGSGNTDTKWYWNLTRHIYRYRPGQLPGVYSKEHGVNEFIPVDSHLHLIAFFYEYILSVDEAEDTTEFSSPLFQIEN
ncbi:hypothetical protein OGAPHI_004683 [Ogataea philodendri]|uniref:Peptidase M20 dimerisation domain-containing protein n=2 Tax=Ogataea TaxID=461281 RepID=A0A9P8P2N4_9ASCO|nr:uncharacterized protein OGAPHI_004683 [Ogataea philodendri]KAH3663969.1 hypothetical protein OGAPHI_004683 [Ogataea philodendri]